MDHEHATDTELLRACRRGNERAARALHARLAPMLRAIARSTLRDQHLAEDAVQRAFCQIMRVSGKEIGRVDNAKAWLIRIVRNESASLARALARARERDQRFSERRGQERCASPGHAGGDGEEPSLAGGSGEIASAIDRLPEELREVIYLKHVAGLTFDQIEAATGINRNTAASRHRRAIALLRDSIDRGEECSREPSPERPAAMPTNPESSHAR